MHVVFTDLDGTLLDHETYAFEQARPALNLLKNLGIPLILASSKTAAEMYPIADRIGIDHPMIVENGAGVVNFPQASADDNQIYERLRSTIAGLPDDLRTAFEGFGDWSAEEVSEKTGMPVETARLAKQRRFSEPGIWRGSEANRNLFRELLNAEGFQAVQGGRFFTLMPRTSKAERMLEITRAFAKNKGDPVTTVALGDAPNDLAMLEAADHGFIIANPAHSPLPETEREREGFIKRSTNTGPSGWNDMIMKLFG